MNGVGGSGDFARNACLSILATGSVAKGGAVSRIVPMVSYVDHTEHDIQVIITEQGLADLCWKSGPALARGQSEKRDHAAHRGLI